METDIHLVPTKCTQLCIDKRPPFQYKVHSSDAISLPASGVQRKLANSFPNSAENLRETPELEMKRVRYEVMKFSSSKLEGREREEADVALAVSLGAMPPKKEFINYKELLHKRSSEKETADVKPHSIAKLKAKLKKGKDKTKKERSKKKGKVKGREKNKVAILQSYGKLNKDKKKKPA